MKIDGMVALVTGAAMGIGKAICQMLLENGAKGVCLVDLVDVGHRTAAELASKYGDGRTIFVKADVTNKEQLEAAFVQTKQQFGRLDIVASNAGVMTEVNYEMMINVNLKATIDCVYLSYKYMSKVTGGDGGVIISTASMAGLMSVGFLPAYCASKWGVVGFVKAMTATVRGKHAGPPAFDRARSGVRLCAMCPDWVGTGLLDASAFPDSEWSAFTLKWKERMAAYDVMTVEKVAASFRTLVEDEDKHGAITLVQARGDRDVAIGYDIHELMSN